MPVAYGGGIRCLEDIRTIFGLGIEKVALNSYAVENPSFVSAAADQFGSQSIVVSIDVKKKRWGGRYSVYTHGGRQSTGLDPVAFAAQMEEMGAGEILLTCIDRDGTQEGYDIELIKRVTRAVRVPVIACGGAGKVEDFGMAVKQGGASACAAGSMVVYFGRNRAVLINFPDREELESVLL
jgi:cyclase